MDEDGALGLSMIVPSTPEGLTHFLDQLDAPTEVRLLPESHPQIKLLMTVPGVGPVFARTIQTEMFDANNFKHPKYLSVHTRRPPLIRDI